MAVFIEEGDAPLSIRQATKRGYQILIKELSNAGARAGDQTLLETIPHEELPHRLIAVVSSLGWATYKDYALSWEADNAVNGAHNLFNHQLTAYRKAVARLAQVELAVGQDEITEEQPTGALDDMGNPVTETVVISEAVAPLVPEDLEYPVFDDETGEQTGTVTEPDRGIVARLERDADERAAAQAVIDQTPAEVVEHAQQAKDRS